MAEGASVVEAVEIISKVWGQGNKDFLSSSGLRDVLVLLSP